MAGVHPTPDIDSNFRNGGSVVEADAGWRSTFLSRTAFPDRDLRYTNGRFGGAKSQWQLSGTDLGGTNEYCVPSPASGEEWKRTFAANEKDKGEAIYYALEIFLTELR